MELELTIFDPFLPSNTLAVLRRIEEILRENRTNTALALDGEALARVQACILILWELAKFPSYNVAGEWSRVRKELEPIYTANRIADNIGK